MIMIIFLDPIPRELQLPGKFVQIINEYCSDIDYNVRNEKLSTKVFYKIG